MDIILAILSVLGFVIAIYQTYIAIVQTRKSQKLEKQRELNLWNQIASMKAMMRHLERKDVHQAYGLVCEQFRNLLKQAAFEEKDFNVKTIKLWRRVGKLSSDWQERQALMLLDTKGIEEAINNPELSANIPISPSTFDDPPENHDVAKLKPGHFASLDNTSMPIVSEENLVQQNIGNLEMKVLFIGEDSEICHKGFQLVKERFKNAVSVFWTYGSKNEPLLEDWEGDLILSFKSDLILKPQFYQKAKFAAINIHPAPPSLRGIGGHVYAIYNKFEHYGVTCHFINNKIDNGPIIKVDRFKVLKNEKASELKKRSDEACYKLLQAIINDVLSGNKLTEDKVERWSGKLNSRKQLADFIENLKKVDKRNNCLK